MVTKDFGEIQLWSWATYCQINTDRKNFTEWPTGQFHPFRNFWIQCLLATVPY